MERVTLFHRGPGDLRVGLYGAVVHGSVECLLVDVSFWKRSAASGQRDAALTISALVSRKEKRGRGEFKWVPRMYQS
jgi:hypothetical protein